MAVSKLKSYLKKNKVNYSTIAHAKAYSAKEVSHVSHISEKSLAKTVIVNIGKKMVMVVLPSSEAIDFEALKKSLHETYVTLASEQDFSKAFPDCEVGAMPPFGNLYGLEVYVEEHLTKNKEIAFNAGTHTEIIKLAYQDFEKLVHPKVVPVTHH